MPDRRTDVETRAPAPPRSPSPLASPADPLLEAALAFTRARGAEHLCAELAQQLRRVAGCDTVAIALVDDTHGGLRLVHRLDGEREAARDERLARSWDAAVSRGAAAAIDEGIELSAPLLDAAAAPLGAVVAWLDDALAPDRRPSALAAFARLCAFAGAALERERELSARERRRRRAATAEVSVGIAQELRNPLFGIASAAQLLRFRTHEDPVVETNVGRILRDVERLNRLTASLLEYGQPHALRRSPGDPDVVWDHVLEAERGALEARALRVERTRATPVVRCAIDAEQLARAFAVVLQSAIDAAPEATDLSLSSTRLPSGGWQCRLTNPGAVISVEALARAFELFFSTTPGAAGTGLAIAQRIVEEHDGTIAIASEPGRGTTVAIALPAVS